MNNIEKLELETQELEENIW